MKNQYSITFLRHAESVLNSKGLFCGRIDCDITEYGKKISRELKDVKPFSDGFDIIYSSPLSRAQQTLNCIFPNTKPINDQRLVVINYGNLEGVRKDSIPYEMIKAYRNGSETPPNGENFHDVEKRFISFLCDIDSKYHNTEKKILVVTHGSILRALGPLCDKSVSKSSNNLDYYTFNQKDIKGFIESFNKINV